jgi:hypothetical protein
MPDGGFAAGIHEEVTGRKGYVWTRRQLRAADGCRN